MRQKRIKKKKKNSNIIDGNCMKRKQNKKKEIEELRNTHGKMHLGKGTTKEGKGEKKRNVNNLPTRTQKKRQSKVK